MKKLIFIFLALCMIGGICYSQVPVKRKKKDKTEQPKSSDNRRKQEAEARHKQEEEAKRQREAEVKRKQEAEARLQREAEAKRKQEEEARQQREAETKRKQEEEARLQREAEAKASKPDGYISDHGYVDLGLPSGLKWATTNIGATSPSDYGSYYAWGETATKSSYTDGNSLTYGNSMKKLRKAGIIGESGTLTMPHDAARSNWGGTWRIPTKKELEELLKECTWTWTSQGGHRGYKVTGPNGRTIFLPAAGWRNGTSLNGSGEGGLYWSSMPNEGASYACGLYFNSVRRSVYWYHRSYGRTVRPVSE